MKKITYNNLLNLSRVLLTSAGLDKFSLKAVSEGLCETSLRGVDSHGIRLLPHYVRSAISGRKNPSPHFKISNNYPSILSIDADNAFGHAAGMKAVEVGTSTAKKYGICAVAVKNSSHPGAMACMTLEGARKGYISIGFTHADALMLSHSGIRPFFGTNPISVAVPRKEKHPYCLDMATTMISWNKLLNYRKENSPVKKGLVANESGDSITDPNEAKALFPAGSYKGFGLASMVEIFCGIYNGMEYGRNIPPMYTTPIELKRRLGQFYIFLKLDGAIDESFFLNLMQSLSDEVRNEPAREGGKVKLPNDPEIETENIRLKEGIPIDDEFCNSINKLLNKFKLKNIYF